MPEPSAPPGAPAPKSRARIMREIFIAYIASMLFAFTGGNMTLPLLQQQLADKYRLLTSEDVLEYYALGQTLPGVMSLNTALLLGRHIAGWPGGLAAAAGTILPAFFGMMLVGLGYNFLNRLSFIHGAIAGIRAASVAIILANTIGILKGAKGAFGWCLAGFAFLAMLVLGWNILLVILLCGLAGVLRALYLARKGGAG